MGVEMSRRILGRPKKHKYRVLIVFLSAILVLSTELVFPVSAQETVQSEQEEASSSDAVAPIESKTPDKDKADQNVQPNSQRATSNDRLFKVLPNFLTLEDAGKRPPLTSSEKFKVVARSSFDYVIYPWYGLLAGFSQVENSERGYGQGAIGYGKRYGAAFADGTIESFMVNAALPSLLRQDPRFYQSSNGRFLHRLGYAVSRIFITRTDSGAEQFNYSEIFGSAIAAGISTYSYHPHADRTLPNTLGVWTSQVGYDTIAIAIKEFWPDIRRMISHRPPPGAEKP
jgi:hypothetical protein